MSKKAPLLLGMLISGLLPAVPAHALGTIQATVDGNTVRAEVSLPGGVGVDVSLNFEQVVGLSLPALGLSAELVSPGDVSLTSRLPSGGLVTLPSAFPVLLTITPPPTGPLSFTGVATLELHTHNLQLTGGCPLRLFAAEARGPFTDITTFIGAGSYRAGGTRPGFSQFLIVSDLRPLSTVISGKFSRLRVLLEDSESEIAAAVYEQLDEQLAAAEQAYAQAAVLTAIRDLEDFMATVQAHGGGDIPNVWRAPRDLVNLAGELRAAAGTLKFSLSLLG